MFGQALTNINQQNISVGKYLVSPLVKDLDEGGFAASVSIRSGHGKGTHDRIMRLTPHFANRASAVRYAIEQGLQFVRERTLTAAHPKQLCFSSIPTNFSR
ncbi:conserved hypothetical protein [Burkholderiales bacterium 8X]|nr:conserved hypothetical protein [Burkholderiales bacterium 8X]